MSVAGRPGPVIVIAAGGTGGHIFPAIATGREISELAPNSTVVYACGERPLEIELYRKNGVEPVIFPARQIRPGIVGKIRGVMAAAGNVWRGRQWVRSVKADLVVGFGGYVAGPTVLGAKFAGCKTALHEANSIPGRTNRILGPMMDITATHFESTLEHLGGRNKLAVGMPLRRLDYDLDRGEARKRLGLDPSMQTLLIMGGSQGAKFLYETIAGKLQELDQAVAGPVQVLWSTGQNNFDELKKQTDQIPLENLKLHLVPFISDMNGALRGADIALARAGASAFAELTSFRIYTVYVPFPGAIYDHQTLNALEAEKYGLGTVIPEKEVGERLIPSLMEAFGKVQSGTIPEPPDSLDSRNAARRLAEKLLGLI